MYHLKRLLRMAFRYRLQYITVLGLLLPIISTRLIAPYITRILVDDVVGNQRTELLTMALAWMISLAALRAGLGYLRGALGESVSQRIAVDLRTQLYKHLHTLPYRFYDENRVGEIMSRMTSDLEGVREFINGGVPFVLEQVIFLVGSMAFLFALSPSLALIALIVAPVLAFLALRFDKRIRPAFKHLREQNANLSTRTQENISGMRVVKAFTQEKHEKETFKDENRRVLDANLTVTRIWSKYFPMIDFVAHLLSPLLFLIGGGMVIGGRLTEGTLVAFTGYIWMISEPMRNIGQLINTIAQAVTSCEKIFYYLDLGSYIKEKERTRYPESFEGHVRFENVNFKYGDNQVLHDISFEVQPGKSLAIMGATGAGKTSIVNLLGRYYERSSGGILIDGIDVRDYALKDLRKNIGYVAQETFLFSETLENNIAFGCPGLDMDHVRACADIAQATEFIAEMPDGYDTLVGERGTGLSGGQKQRVAIARALAIEPKILVLDDSTSSVDMETEFEIQRGLEALAGRRTTFIIAHRISSVKNADEIIVLDGGRIAERGAHRELLDKKGLYYSMYMDQYRDFESISGSQEVG